MRTLETLCKRISHREKPNIPLLGIAALLLVVHTQGCSTQPKDDVEHGDVALPDSTDSTVVEEKFEAEALPLPEDAFLKDREYLVRENTAEDVMQTLSSSEPGDLKADAESLFVDRWIPQPGWIGRISKLPRSTHSGIWQVEIQEPESSTHVRIMHIRDDISNCRMGDVIRVAGRIHGVHEKQILVDQPTIVSDCLQYSARD